jgi:pimeloyl-ACP methyl ester carboxylesterase
MNEVRTALGYHRIALWGVSYGSEFVFEYVRTHGPSVQSAVLEDIAPPQFRVFPPFERGASKAIAYADRGLPMTWPAWNATVCRASRAHH